MAPGGAALPRECGRQRFHHMRKRIVLHEHANARQQQQQPGCRCLCFYACNNDMPPSAIGCLDVVMNISTIYQPLSILRRNS